MGSIARLPAVDATARSGSSPKSIHPDPHRDDVASVRGRPWCGKDACQQLFGASVLRLRVTYNDGTTSEYLCGAGPLAIRHASSLARIHELTRRQKQAAVPG